MISTNICFALLQGFFFLKFVHSIPYDLKRSLPRRIISHIDSMDNNEHVFRFLQATPSLPTLSQPPSKRPSDSPSQSPTNFQFPPPSCYPSISPSLSPSTAPSLSLHTSLKPSVTPSLVLSFVPSTSSKRYRSKETKSNRKSKRGKNSSDQSKSRGGIDSKSSKSKGAKGSRSSISKNGKGRKKSSSSNTSVRCADEIDNIYRNEDGGNDELRTEDWANLETSKRYNNSAERFMPVFHLTTTIGLSLACFAGILV